MVVDDLDIVGMAIVPFEADPPLVVDPDGPLAFPLAPQGLKPVSGRNPEIVQALRAVKQVQLAPCLPLDPAPPRHIEVIEETLCYPVPKRPDHLRRMAGCELFCKAE
jgi:hypothetical protein